MPDTAGAKAGAYDATVAVAENESVEDRARRVRRLNADVTQARRVLDELVDGAARQEKKAAEVVKVYEAKSRETAKMVDAARKAVKNAEQALKKAEAG